MHVNFVLQWSTDCSSCGLCMAQAESVAGSPSPYYLTAMAINYIGIIPLPRWNPPMRPRCLNYVDLKIFKLAALPAKNRANMLSSTFAIPLLKETNCPVLESAIALRNEGITPF